MMQTLQIPFIAGVNEELDDKVLPSPRLTKLINRRVVRPGSTEKRRGVADVGVGDPDLSNPRRIIKYQSELLALDSEAAFVETNTSGWSKLEDTSSVTLEEVHPLGAYSYTNVVATAAAATSQRLVQAWATFDGTNYTLQIAVNEFATSGDTEPIGTILSTVNPATEVPGVDAPGVKCLKAAVSGSNVFVMWGDTSNRIRGIIVTTSAEGEWVSGDITTFVSNCDQTALNFFDIDAHSTGLVLAYTSTTANTVTLIRYDSAGVSQDSASINVGGATPKVGIVGDVGSNAHLHVVFGSGASAEHKVYRLNTDMTTAASYSEGPGSIYAGAWGIACGKYDSTNSVIAYAEGTTSMLIHVHNGGAAPTITSDRLYDMTPVSKPFTRNGRVFIATQVRHSQANSYTGLVSLELASGDWGQVRAETRFLDALTPADIPDNVAVSIAQPFEGTDGASRLLDSRIVIPVRNVDRTSDPSLFGLVSEGQQVITVVRADSYVFSLNSPKMFLSAELGGKLFIGGGQVMQYDGRRFTEVGFWAAPAVASSDLTISYASGNMALGAYGYAFVWEWFDASGARHQSAPNYQTVELTATGQVTINVPSLQQTRKHWYLAGDDARGVTFAIYRTEVNEQTYHRLEGDGLALFTENAPNAAVSGSYVDSYSDADAFLNTREILYTGPGGSNELENLPPPPSRVIIAHQDRLFGINDENPTTLWYSKALRPRVGLAWNPALIVQLQEPATALASQDDNLIVFTERSVYTVLGQGADNTGVTTNYEPPQRLSSETGCIEPRSVVSCRAGIFFQSQQGIELLQRGNFTAAHDPSVQQTLESYPTITGAVDIPDDSRVCFACATNDDLDADSRVLVYDYGAQIWSVYDYGDGFLIASLANDNGALCWASQGTYGSDNHLVARENNTFKDQLRGADSFIATTLETGDIRVGGLTGYSRVKHANLLAETLGATNLNILEGHDSGATWDQTSTWAMTAESESIRRQTLVTQKCTSVRFRITESTSGTTDTQGLRLFGLELKTKPLSGGRRHAAAERL